MGQSKTISLWISPFSAWWQTSDNQVILVQACSWPVWEGSLLQYKNSNTLGQPGNYFQPTIMLGPYEKNLLFIMRSIQNYVGRRRMPRPFEKSQQWFTGSPPHHTNQAPGGSPQLSFGELRRLQFNFRNSNHIHTIATTLTQALATFRPLFQGLSHKLHCLALIWASE